MYTPKPIDTSDIMLTDDIMELCELISKIPTRYGLKTESMTVGYMEKHEMMKRSIIRA